MYQKISRSGKKIKSCDVYIGDARKGRGWNLKASKWVAPANITDLPYEEMCEAYEKRLMEEHLIEDIYELSHQKLGCWCSKKEQCHASVLINLIERYEGQNFAHDEDIKDLPSLKFERIPILRAKHVPSISHKKMKAIVGCSKMIVFTKEDIRREVERVKTLVAKGQLKDGQRPIDLLKVNWEKDQIPIASIPFDFIMTEPVRCEVKMDLVEREKTEREWLLKQQDEASIISPIFVELTPKSIARLRSTSNVEWNPFICRIHKVIFNKRINRFSLQVSDNSDIFKVELGSQLFPLIKSRFLSKGDIIRVSDYTITTYRPSPNDEDQVVTKSKVKKIVIVCTIQKYV